MYIYNSQVSVQPQSFSTSLVLCGTCLGNNAGTAFTYNRNVRFEFPLDKFFTFALKVGSDW